MTIRALVFDAYGTAPTGSHAGPSGMFWLMRGYAEHLGHTVDWRVSRLTDLAPLWADLAK